ncbi:hypothetical protein [Wohlfahrtiimonas larvae]|uniref:Uncharacterized protein n=1 Tax=Wohlfahrtiimonas larvae TaxID=1157986 RepID=A0ABP9MWP0_9GAMM|nr:hypothetical protein [Wohlfahrtiimonas larvae]
MKKEQILLIVGGVLLVIGVVLSMMNGGADNTAIAQQATNAQEAALAISANNQKEIIMNAISMFLIGFGGVLIAIPALKFLKKKN